MALVNVSGDALYQEFKKQEELVKVTTAIAEKVVAAKDKDVSANKEYFMSIQFGSNHLFSCKPKFFSL